MSHEVWALPEDNYVPMQNLIHDGWIMPVKAATMMSEAPTVSIDADLEWPSIQSKLLAAAAAATAAATDLIENARGETEIFSRSNVGSGETLSLLLDATRLLIQANGYPERDNQLIGALEKWLRDEGYLHD